MPKIYTEQEKEDIKSRLKAAASKRMREKGMQKTTVDYLVTETGIPKGTFYLLYESKEMLLFEVLLEFHAEMENDIFNRIYADKENMNTDKLTEIIADFYIKCQESFLVRVMMGGDLEYLFSKLPKDMVVKHLEHDEDNVAKIFKMLVLDKEFDTSAVSAAFQEIFFSLQYREQLGDEYDKGMKLLIKGIVSQILDNK